MGQLRWRVMSVVNRLKTLPGKAVEAFWRGYDRKQEEQWNGPPEPSDGLEIRVNGVSETALAETAAAISTLIKVVPGAAAGVDLWKLNRALDKLTIEWVNHEVPEYRMLHRRGHRWLVRAQWMGTVWESQLFHALLHFVNLAVRVTEVADDQRDLFIRHDNDHAEVEYWGLELVLCQRERPEDD